MDEILVIDTETSLHNSEVGKFLAHPQARNNWIVWLGGIRLDREFNPLSGTELACFPRLGMVDLHAPPVTTLLVGHNIGFDLLHLCNPSNKGYESWIAWINHPDTLVWDTMIAEYRLLGQTEINPSLDWCCQRRGWPVKPGRLKEYWAAGISTEDIPDEEVRPYLTHDVDSTARLLKDQLIMAAQRGMLDMLRIEMKSRMTTLVMEHNGMHFNREAPYRDEVTHDDSRDGAQRYALQP